MNGEKNTNGRNYTRLIFTAAFVFAGLWFAFEIISILFLFFFATSKVSRTNMNKQVEAILNRDA